DVPDRLEQAAVVEPVHPFEGCVFHGLEAAPGPPTVDDLGLEEPVDRLGQRVVVAVTDAANRRLDARLGQPFSVFDRQILAAAVAVVNQPYALDRAAVMDRLFEGIKDEPGIRRGADPPADNLAGISVDDESDINKPLP